MSRLLFMMILLACPVIMFTGCEDDAEDALEESIESNSQYQFGSLHGLITIDFGEEGIMTINNGYFTWQNFNYQASVSDTCEIRTKNGKVRRILVNDETIWKN